MKLLVYNNIYTVNDAYAELDSGNIAPSMLICGSHLFF